MHLFFVNTYLNLQKKSEVKVLSFSHVYLVGININNLKSRDFKVKNKVVGRLKHVLRVIPELKENILS